MNPDWRRLKSGSDIRGNEDELTDEFAEKLGYAFAVWLAERRQTTPDRLTIAVGRDSRRSGPRLKAALIRGITSADTDVLDCGLCTTPAMFLTTVDPSTKADGAVMLTASHHPPRKNGFKFITAQGGLSGDDISRLIALAMERQVPVRLVRPVNFLDAYCESLKDMIRTRLEDDSLKPLLGLHVVVDAGNGAGGFYARCWRTWAPGWRAASFSSRTGSFPTTRPIRRAWKPCGR